MPSTTRPPHSAPSIRPDTENNYCLWNNKSYFANWNWWRNPLREKADFTYLHQLSGGSSAASIYCNEDGCRLNSGHCLLPQTSHFFPADPSLRSMPLDQSLPIFDSLSWGLDFKSLLIRVETKQLFYATPKWPLRIYQFFRSLLESNQNFRRDDRANKLMRFGGKLYINEHDKGANKD